MTRPTLWIGMGTGRCGTASLALLLNAQPGATATHEASPVLPWAVDPAALERRVEALVAREGRFAADVALSYLPYADLLLERHPDTRLVVLRRDREATVRSFERLAGGRNHFVEHVPGAWRSDPRWDRCFPTYDEPNRRRALLRYWDEYSERADALAHAHPDRVLVAEFPAALSSEEGVRRVLTHLGVDRGEQVVRTDVHANRGSGVVARWKRVIAHRLRRHHRDTGRG